MRRLILFSFIILMAIVAKADDSGSCGENVTYTYVETSQTLTISGSGAISDYKWNNSPKPWASYKDNIKKIIIENGITYIGKDAFYECTELTSVTIPNTVSRIENGAFFGCKNITAITIPNSVTYIVPYAFYGCESLALVTLHCNSIGDWLRAEYLGTSGPEEVILGDEVTIVNAYAFQNCKNLKYVKGCKGIKKIECNAFENCECLKTIDLPEGLETIENSAFYNCECLDNIIIPSSVNEIGGEAFLGCSGIKTVTINCKTVGNWFANKESIETVVLGEGVSTISDYAFNECVGIKSIYLSNSLESIGIYGLGYCSSIESIILPNNLIEVKDDAFYGCTGLKTVTINSPVVGNWFNGFESIETIILGDEVTTISDEAFYGCSGLASVIFSGGLNNIGSLAFYDCSSLETITLPESLKTIGSSAFEGCSSLKTVQLFNGLESIGTSAFDDCSSLETITLPETLKTIGSSAFDDCSSLKTITLPPNLTSIGSNAFSYTGIQRVNSNIVTPFAVSAFDWSNAVLVVPQGTKSDYKSVSGWKDAVIFVDGETIYDKNYTDEQGIKYTLYQNDDGCYYDVTGHTEDLMTEIVIPNKINDCHVKGVAYSSFRDCTNLKKVTFSDGLSNINFSTFEGCISLKEFVSNIKDPSTVSGSVPKEIYERAHLTVPVGTKAAYLALYNWKYFNIYEEGETVVEHERNLTDEQGLKYELRQNATTFYYAVTGHTDALAERVTIPEILADLPVTEISGYVFKNCTGLKWISIPKTITSMGSKNNAFGGCSLTLSLNQKKVEGWSSCDFITKLELGNEVDTIASSAFYNNKNLVTVSFPEKMDSIASHAFEGCISLEAASLPKGIKHIAYQTFYGCASLATVTLPESLLSIEGSAFQGCASLATINLPENLLSIGGSAFAGCSSLQTITIPKNIVEYGYSVFDGCTSLKTVNYEATRFVDWFKGNTAITELNLGEGVEEIYYYGDIGVIGCTGLERITVYEGNKVYDSRDNCNAIILKETNTLLQGCKNTLIPESVTAIAQSAFRNLSTITEISIPANVNGIGDRAFDGCSGLQNVTSYIKTPYNIYNVFDEDVLKTATLHVPFGLTNLYKEVGGWDFNNIAEMAGNEDETTFITFADSETKALCVKNWDINKDGEISIEEAKQVTEIPNYFASNSNLASFNELKQFVNITCIGSSAFYNCTNLSEIEWPEKVTAIADYTFSGCSSLTSVTIPNSVTSIGGGAFYNCSSLTSVTIPNSVTSIGVGAFYNCSSLTSVTIPNSVTSIGRGAFKDCKNLTSITLPEGLMTIGESAFENSGLTSLTIPSTIVSIGDYALAGDVIYCNLTTPISVGTLMSNAWDVVLHVPDGCEQAFSEADGWKNFLIVGTSNTAIDWSEGEVTVVVNEPGELRLTMVERDEESIARLKIRGQLNSEDIKYLIEGSSKIANLESLDLSEVTFDYDGGCYYSKKMESGDMWGYYMAEEYYLTDNEYITYPSSGAFSHTSTTAYHSPNLDGAFQRKSYKHVVMPKSVRKAGVNTFLCCTELQSVDYPAGINQVGESAFLGCSKLQSIKLAEVDTIGNEAFRDCTMLQNIENISRVKSIGEKAFSGCKYFTGDKGVLQLNQVDSIPKEAFVNCKMLTSISLSDNLYYIGDYAFAGCSSLSSITLPNSLITLSTGAFNNCTTLENVTCSSNLTQLDYTCFQNTPFMDNLPVTEGIKYLGNIALSYDMTSRVAASSPATLSFKEGTTLIANNFIESLYINNVDDRSNVTKLNLPSTLVRIGKNAFGGSNIASLSMPEGISEIGDNAFYGSQITKVTLAEDLKTIEENAFGNCKQLSVVNYNTVEVVGQNIFSGCTSLEKVNIGPKVKRLPDGIFSGCTALTLVKAEERTDGTPMDIGKRTFSGCEKLTSLNLPQDIVVIEEDAFSYCSSLKSFVASESLETIGPGAFRGCTGLTSVQLNMGLKTIADGAFSYCYYLPSIQLPESLDSLGYEAFGDCYSLTELTIPAAVSRLGAEFVYNCCNIIQITCLIKNPISLDGVIGISNKMANELYGYDPQVYNPNIDYKFFYGDVTLYVPDGTKTLYRNTDGWSRFVNIEELSGNDVTAKNKMYVARTLVTRGETVSLAIELNNAATDFTAYQFDLVLPVGFTIAKNTQGEYDVKIGSRYSDANQTIAVEKLAVNKYSGIVKYRFVSLSPQNGCINDNSGALLTLTLEASSTMKEDEYKARLENIIFSQTDGTRNALDNYQFILTFNPNSEVTLGDVNEDGDVDVSDAVAVINFILGNITDIPDLSLYDINNDNDVDVFDVTKIIYIILSNNSSVASSRAASRSEDYLENIRVRNERNSLRLGVDLAERFTAFQFDIEIPEGIEMIGVGLSGSTTNHMIQFSKINECQYRVVGLSMDGETLPSAIGQLIEISLSGNVQGRVNLYNVLFVTPEGKRVVFGSEQQSTPTDIHTIEDMQNEDNIYDMSGRKLNISRNQLGSGMYIINQKKVVIK